MKRLFSLPLVAAAILLAGCAKEYNAVYRTTDTDFKYEYAKHCFAMGQWSRATTLLGDLINLEKGTENAEESLYMLGMAQYNDRDYEGAAATFDKYFKTYPRGAYSAMAAFFTGQSLYMSTPEPRLDQSRTVSAIASFQVFLDRYPEHRLRELAQQRLFELQDKLVRKELYSAKLYYDLGSYFGNCTYGGNNYEACIITAQNALKDYPYTKLRENFALLIMKSKFELAEQSVDEMKLDRYQDAEDECYGFINEYPDSRDKGTAEKYIASCKQYIARHANDKPVATEQRETPY